MGLKIFDGSEQNGNVFVVETKVKAGTVLDSHEHKHSHLSVLVSGSAEVEVNNETNTYSGYNILTVPADTTHKVTALTDIIWLCIWDADLAPKDEAEQALKLIERLENEN
jgi:quercetin dioxygenase-like cupin family protein